jgi:hypothetical protein
MSCMDLGSPLAPGLCGEDNAAGMEAQCLNPSRVKAGYLQPIPDVDNAAVCPTASLGDSPSGPILVKCQMSDRSLT